MTFTTPWFTFEVTVMMLLASVLLILFFISAAKKKREEATAHKVDHGEIKPVPLSKITKRSGNNAVPTIRVAGPIMTSPGLLPVPSSKVTYGEIFAERLGQLADSSSVAAIIVDLATPGGTVTGSERIRDAIERAQEKKPVFVYVSEMAASGGMWALSTAKDVTTAPGSILGSVGVVSGTLMKYDGVKKVSNLFGSGVEAETITGEVMFSGSGKALGHPFAPDDLAAKERMQGWLDDTRGEFIELLTSRKGVDRQKLEAQGASVYGPSKAQEIGVIDRILSRFKFDEYVAEKLGKKVEELDFMFVARVSRSPFKGLFSYVPGLSNVLARFGAETEVDPMIALRREPMLAVYPRYIDQY